VRKKADRSRWWYDAHDLWRYRDKADFPPIEEIEYQWRGINRALLAEVWGNHLVTGSDGQEKAREAIADALRHCVSAAGWDVAVPLDLRVSSHALVNEALRTPRNNVTGADGTREIWDLFEEQKVFERLGNHYWDAKVGGLSIQDSVALHSVMISFLDLANLYIRFRPTQFDAIHEEFRSADSLKRLRSLIATLEKLEEELSWSFSLMKTVRPVEREVRERLEAVPKLLTRWRGHLASVPDEIARARSGEEPDPKKASFRDEWEKLARSRTNRPLHAVGAAMYEVIFGVTCETDNYIRMRSRDRKSRQVKAAEV